MFKFVLVTKADDIRNLSGRVLGHRYLPPFLFSEERYTPIVIGMEKDNGSIGFAYGVTEHGACTFFLHFLFVKKEYRSHLAVISLLEAILLSAKNIKSVTEVVWKYVLEAGESDPREKFISHISFCYIKELKSSRKFRVRTIDIDYIRQFKIYNPMLWKEKGYNVLPWSDCDDSVIARIWKTEESSTHSRDYISPFNETHEQKYDLENSYIMLESKSMKPMGWIMCSIVSENEVTIRNFYMYPKERAMIIAHSFATYILDVVASRYEYLSFSVVRGNRQMEIVAKKYFEPILESSNTQHNLFIGFSE